jgi:aminoglycoside phosphotransferase (APT) family kinase protein
MLITFSYYDLMLRGSPELKQFVVSRSGSKDAEPESIQRFGEAKLPAPAPVTFLSPTSGDELLAW